MHFLQHPFPELAATIAIGLLNAPAGDAQSPSASRPPISYVASVKPNNSAEPRTLIDYYPGGRLRADAVTVAALLRLAYRIQDYRILGAPAWFSTNRYDIAAKVDDNPPPSQQVFLQTLLADRFHLAVHQETRDRPTFTLVLARSDRKLGPQLIPSDFDCAAYAAAPHAPPDPARTPNCATRINIGALSGKAIPMTQLATSLAPFLSRFTIDKTGLTGRFDVEFTWTPDEVPANAPDSVGPALFTAIQEQLGLKLVSGRGPVDVLVVDRSEKPSEN
jgi:uncharacterized protein (TIGR03435 family)